MPEANVPQCLGPVKSLVSGLEIDGFIVSFFGGDVVVPVVNIHVDPAQGISNILECLKGHFDVFVRGDAKIMQRLDCEFGASIGVGGIQSILAMAGNGDPHVPGQRENRQIVRVRVDVDDHHRIRPRGGVLGGGPLVISHDQNVHGRRRTVIHSKVATYLLIQDRLDPWIHPAVGAGDFILEPSVRPSRSQEDHQSRADQRPKHDTWPSAPWALCAVDIV